MFAELSGALFCGRNAAEPFQKITKASFAGRYEPVMIRALEMPLNGKDRLLVLAPHPDDESLATGGLIQRATRQGLPVKVVFLTNGQNNPWAQRIVERRWRIGPADQRR
jgi:hypothetical protein